MLEVILSALTAGAQAVRAGAAGQAEMDVYSALKRALAGKFGNLAGPIGQLESKPDSEPRQAVLREELVIAKAGDDAEVVRLAQAMLDAVQRSGAGRTVSHNSGIALQGGTVGGDVVLGDKVGRDQIGTQINHTGDLKLSVDKIEINLQVAQAVLSAVPQIQAAPPDRRTAIAAYFRDIAATLGEVSQSLRQGTVPHGKCGEMLGYAHMLPAQIGDFIGQQQAGELGERLRQSYDVEQFLSVYANAPDKNSKFAELDVAAGYFTAAASSIVVGPAASPQIYAGGPPGPTDAALNLPPGAQALAKLLNDAFDLDELRGVCFDLNTDWDNLRGETKAAKARELVAYCARLTHLDDLKKLMLALRPNLAAQLG